MDPYQRYQAFSIEEMLLIEKGLKTLSKSDNNPIIKNLLSDLNGMLLDTEDGPLFGDGND